MLTIAIAKGRMQRDALELLRRVGVSEEALASRRLVVNRASYQLKASAVGALVEALARAVAVGAAASDSFGERAS